MPDAHVNTPSPAWDEMEKDRKLARTLLYGGQRGIRNGGTTWLPKHPAELGSADKPESDYGRRLSRAYLVNFYQDAVRNLVGRIFQKDLQTTDLHPRLQEFWKDVDDCGTPGQVFIERVAMDSLGQGFSSILVDGIATGDADNEAAENVGARWTHVLANNLIEAEERRIEGRDVLWRARRREQGASLVSGYDYAEFRRVRVFNWADPVSTWVLFEQDEDDEWRQIASGTYTPHRRASADQRLVFRQPPIVPFYSNKTGFFNAVPPMLGLADLNLQHYQKKSDLDLIETMANLPQLVARGVTDDAEFLIGPMTVQKIPENAELKWLEIQGNGIKELKVSIKHLEEHIRLAGREPMVKKATGSELATVRLLDEQQHMTLAQAWAQSWVSSINRALFLTAGYLGVQDPGEVAISEDVMESLSRPEAFEDVKELGALGLLSKRAVLEEAVRYGVLDREFDVDAELADQELEDPGEPLPPEGDEPIAE